MSIDSFECINVFNVRTMNYSTLLMPECTAWVCRTASECRNIDAEISDPKTGDKWTSGG